MSQAQPHSFTGSSLLISPSAGLTSVLSGFASTRNLNVTLFGNRTFADVIRLGEVILDEGGPEIQ